MCVNLFRVFVSVCVFLGGVFECKSVCLPFFCYVCLCVCVYWCVRLFVCVSVGAFVFACVCACAYGFVYRVHLSAFVYVHV